MPSRFINGFNKRMRKAGLYDEESYLHLMKLADQDQTLEDDMIKYSFEVLDKVWNSPEFSYIRSRAGSPENLPRVMKELQEKKAAGALLSNAITNDPCNEVLTKLAMITVTPMVKRAVSIPDTSKIRKPYVQGHDPGPRVFNDIYIGGSKPTPGMNASKFISNKTRQQYPFLYNEYANMVAGKKFSSQGMSDLNNVWAGLDRWGKNADNTDTAYQEWSNAFKRGGIDVRKLMARYDQEPGQKGYLNMTDKMYMKLGPRSKEQEHITQFNAKRDQDIKAITASTQAKVYKEVFAKQIKAGLPLDKAKANATAAATQAVNTEVAGINKKYDNALSSWERPTPNTPQINPEAYQSATQAYKNKMNQIDKILREGKAQLRPSKNKEGPLPMFMDTPEEERARIEAYKHRDDLTPEQIGELTAMRDQVKKEYVQSVGEQGAFQGDPSQFRDTRLDTTSRPHMAGTMGQTPTPEGMSQQESVDSGMPIPASADANEPAAAAIAASTGAPAVAGAQPAPTPEPEPVTDVEGKPVTPETAAADPKTQDPAVQKETDAAISKYKEMGISDEWVQRLKWLLPLAGILVGAAAGGAMGGGLGAVLGGGLIGIAGMAVDHYMNTSKFGLPFPGWDDMEGLFAGATGGEAINPELRAEMEAAEAEGAKIRAARQAKSVEAAKPKTLTKGGPPLPSGVSATGREPTYVSLKSPIKVNLQTMLPKLMKHQGKPAVAALIPIVKNIASKGYITSDEAIAFKNSIDSKPYGGHIKSNLAQPGPNGEPGIDTDMLLRMYNEMQRSGSDGIIVNQELYQKYRAQQANATAAL
jgi:hypothetical protein